MCLVEKIRKVVELEVPLARVARISRRWRGWMHAHDRHRPLSESEIGPEVWPAAFGRADHRLLDDGVAAEQDHGRAIPPALRRPMRIILADRRQDIAPSL